jgi:hypothetical protein
MRSVTNITYKGKTDGQTLNNSLTELYGKAAVSLALPKINFTCLYKGDVICILYLTKSLGFDIGPVVAKCHCDIINAGMEPVIPLNFMTIHRVHFPSLSNILSRVWK